MGKGRKTAILTFVALVVVAKVMPLQSAEGKTERAIPESHELFADIPRKGTVTMLDLGADFCVPCKMMAPTLRKLQEQFKAKADIIFIDIKKHPEQGKRFKVRAMPTQVFFDAQGKEVDRHIGFLKEGAIIGKLKSLGIE